MAKEEKNPFKVGRTEAEPTMVKVSKITAEDGGDKEAGSFTISRPLKVKIIDEDKEVVFNDFTTKTAYTENWARKFYINKSNYVGYTQDDVLLALIKIFATTKDGKNAVKQIDEGDFDVKENIEGMKFEAILREYNGDKFIDWVATFNHNKVEVPSKDEIMASRGKSKVKDEEDEDEDDDFDDEDEKPKKKKQSYTRDEAVEKGKKKVKKDEDEDDDQDEDDDDEDDDSDLPF